MNDEQVKEQKRVIIGKIADLLVEYRLQPYAGAIKILSLLQPLIDQAVNHEANEWIAGISEALGRGYFVYDPKLGRTGSISQAVGRVVAQAKAKSKQEVIKNIKAHGYLVYDLEMAKDRGVDLGDMIIPKPNNEPTQERIKRLLTDKEIFKADLGYFLSANSRLTDLRITEAQDAKTSAYYEKKIAQACADERAKVIEKLEKYKYSISLNNVTFRIPKAEWEALKSGQKVKN